MFTGIVETKGVIARREPSGEGEGDLRVRIDAPGFGAGAPSEGVGRGDSVCVSGVCLTAAEPTQEGFWADVSAETLACTTLGRLAPGDLVNLERSLTPQTPLGGHLVSGHVDGVGEVRSRSQDARSIRLRFAAPAELARYIAVKGSVCVDGVSLTVNEVDGACFGVNVVPHTLTVTTLSGLDAGHRVNLEVDLVARYLERLLQERAPQGAGAAGPAG